MKRYLVLLIIASLLLSGCQGAQGIDLLGLAGELANTCEVKVGILTNLQSAYGQEQLNGYEMAKDEINAAGGVNGCNLTLLSRDDANDPAKAEILAAGLIESDQVPVILGSYSGATTLAAARVANQRQTALLSPVTISRVITQMGYDYTFSFAVNADTLVQTAFDWAQTTAPAETPPRAAVLFESDLTGLAVADSLLLAAMERGISLVAYESFYSGEQNFVSILANIQASQPDLLFVFIDTPADLALLLEQIRNIGFSPAAVIGIGGAFASAEYLNGEIANSQYTFSVLEWYQSAPWKDEAGRDAAAFIKAYQERFNKFPGQSAVQAYVSLKVVKIALERALQQGSGGLTLNTARYLRNLSLPQTLEGEVLFDANGFNSTNQPILVQILNGKPVAIYPPQLKQAEVVYPAPAWNQR